MDNFKLISTIRNDSGKGVARKLRAAGRLPAILYGQKEKPVELTIVETEIRQILHKHPDSAIVDLDVEGGKSGINAVIRDVQRHPATGRLLHVDFQRIRLDEEVRIDIHVALQGIPVGVKDQGGILEHVTRSLTGMCLPASIPDAITLDVSGLEIHDSLKLKDVVARYPDVEFLDDPEAILATVIPPVVEKVTEEEAEGAQLDAELGAEPEVISQESGKTEEESKE